jgi:hypothetical protein
MAHRLCFTVDKSLNGRSWSRPSVPCLMQSGKKHLAIRHTISYTARSTAARYSTTTLETSLSSWQTAITRVSRSWMLSESSTNLLCWSNPLYPRDQLISLQTQSTSEKVLFHRHSAAGVVPRRVKSRWKRWRNNYCMKRTWRNKFKATTD